MTSRKPLLLSPRRRLDRRTRRPPALTHCSSNLSWAELACHDTARTPYPDLWRTTRAVALAAVFEAIRAECGHQPIRIASAYRTEAHNRRVRGAPHSQHVQGRALDLVPPVGMTVQEFYRRIRGLVETVPDLRGLGFYRKAGFVHIDTRPSPRLVVWSGQAALKEART
jgi:hypothetical protein